MGNVLVKTIGRCQTCKQGELAEDGQRTEMIYSFTVEQNVV